MASDSPFDGYLCHTCGQFHSGLPMSYGADYPDSYAWLKPSEKEQRALVGSDQCIIDGEAYFVRGLIEVPVIGFHDRFLWGVWARIWKKDFDEMSELWETQGRESRSGPYKGRLNNVLSEYPDTLNLKCTIRIQPVGSRPLFFIDETDHPLGREQREGITLERVQQIASHLMHHDA